MPDGQGNAPTTFQYRDLHARIEDVLAKELFFIGAYPKSGTSWLQRALNAHPEICCNGEGHFMNHFGRLLETALRNHNKYINDKNTKIFSEFAPFPGFDLDHFRYLLMSAVALVLHQFPGFQDARVIGEKTPDNLGYFSHLALLFPQAKFVHVVRDARDCAVSAWFHNLRVNSETLLKRFPTMDSFLEYAAGDWKKRVEAGVRLCIRHPDRAVIVHYENMSRHAEKTLAALFTFLGVDATPDVLRPCAAAGSFEAMSGGRAPGVEDRSSFMRQGKPGNWRQHFTKESNEKFLAVTGPLMKQLGYRV